MPGVRFPATRSVLWDRTPLNHPVYIRFQDIIPPLYLTASAIRLILQGLCQTDTSIQNHVAIAIPYQSVIGELSGASRSNDALPYILCIDEVQPQDHRDDYMALTIPFQQRLQADDLIFKADSTS